MIDADISAIYGVEIDPASIIYNETRSDWSFGYILIIFKENEKFFVVDDFDSWVPYEVSQEDALQKMMDFESELGEF
jgi:hypothetical protein